MGLITAACRKDHGRKGGTGKLKRLLVGQMNYNSWKLIKCASYIPSSLERK
jgi:hypothetical protein